MFLDEVDREEQPTQGKRGENMSDEAALQASILDPDCFEILVLRYQDTLLRKARHILKNREAAEDVVQEAFAKMYLNAHRFKVQEGASFRSWAYRIVINTAITRYQKQKREQRTTVDLDPEVYESLKDTEALKGIEQKEAYDYVISILARIPDNLGKVLKLHFLEGKPQQEIADLEETSVGAIKTRVHRAKQAFRDESKNDLRESTGCALN